MLRIEFIHCHKLPKRSFFWRGKQFPVCARCTGIYLAQISLLYFAFNQSYLNIYQSICLCVPAFIDGTTQALGWRESSNFLRLITGIALGVGQCGFIALVGNFILIIIKNIF